MLIRVLLVLLATTSVAFSQEQDYGKFSDTISRDHGDWHIEIRKSDFTDGRNVVMVTESKTEISCGRASSLSSPLQLVLICDDNSTSVYVAAEHCYFTSGLFYSYGDVKYRVDKKPAKTREFSESTTNQALGLWGGEKSIPFIKELIGHDKIVMRVTPYRETYENVTFSLNGFDDSIEHLRKSCSW